MPSGNAIVTSSGYQGGRAFVFVSGANGAVQVVANSVGANSDIGNPAANDFVTGATIASVWWSLGTGTSTIARGANVVLNLNGTGWMGRDQGWPGCNLYFGAANVVISVPANSTVIVELTKEYSAGSR